MNTYNNIRNFLKKLYKACLMDLRLWHNNRLLLLLSEIHVAFNVETVGTFSFIFICTLKSKRGRR